MFAFIIKMPTLHRLAVFRDDIIFFIFLYQVLVLAVLVSVFLLVIFIRDGYTELTKLDQMNTEWFLKRKKEKTNNSKEITNKTKKINKTKKRRKNKNSKYFIHF